MKIVLNGEEYEHAGAACIVGLLKAIPANPQHVAVMVNDRVVPRSEFPETPIAEGDHVEVLTYAGGGQR